MRKVFYLQDFGGNLTDFKTESKNIQKSDWVVLVFAAPSKKPLMDDFIQSFKGKINEVIIEGEEFKEEDLHFLEKTPSVHSLVFKYAFGIKDLGFLSPLGNLKVLTLSEVAKKASLKTLPPDIRITRLELVGAIQDLAAIGEIKTLERVRLNSQKYGDLDFMRELPNLVWLSLLFGSYGDLHALGKTKLRYLKLHGVKNLSDLEFIGEIVSLKYLELEKLNEVTKLPDLSKLLKLSRVNLDQMKKVTDLSPLLPAKNLEEFYFSEAKHLRLEDFKVLARHPKLKAASIGLGSDKRNEEVQDLLQLPPVPHPFEFELGS